MASVTRLVKLAHAWSVWPAELVSMEMHGLVLDESVRTQLPSRPM